MAASHLNKGRAYTGGIIHKKYRSGGLYGLCLYEPGENSADPIF